MKPFNFELMIEDPSIVTRIGLPVTQLQTFILNNKTHLLGVVNEVIYHWNLDGKCISPVESDIAHNYDLFMDITTVECWGNVYKTADDKIIVNAHYTDYETAFADKHNFKSTKWIEYIKTIKIHEWEK